MEDLAPTRLGVGELIANARRRRGISQRQLSAAANRAPAYVSKIERGDVQPTLRCFAAMAVALDMNPLELSVVIQAEALRDDADRAVVTPDTYADTQRRKCE